MPKILHAPYNLQVAEMPGDAQLSKQQLHDTTTIATTPKKWDQAGHARDAKYAHFENCEAALATAAAELGKARGGNGASAPPAPAALATGSRLLSAVVTAPSSVGAFSKETYEDIGGAALVCGVHVAVDAARADHVATSDAVAKEVNYVQAAWSADFKEMFSDYADGQVEYFERSMILALEGIQLDD
ncbi:hypothetical protein GGF32_002422 [Allomyces javanicus]|nr:hypothetical protein GGF32_002422 [Allomyces javanicus]